MTAGAGRDGRTGGPVIEADVVVVGAGPAGSSAAYWLAAAGLDVVMLEKTRFPRDKVCGDGLTPRAVKSLLDMGVDVSTSAGWTHNKGLRVVGSGNVIELDWPAVASYPPYGLVRPRRDFDDILARRAVQAGATLRQQVSVTGPVLDTAGRVVGVTASQGPQREPASFRAPFVIAADGVSGRLALSLGLSRIESRPMGVAVRSYYRSPRHDDDYLESWLELWDRGESGRDVLLPGYGWIFPMGDGTVNVGLGILSTSAAYGRTDYRKLLQRWVGQLPTDWGISEQTRTEPIRGAALPMGINRKPVYTRGLLLVGDVAGVVNPFNGEGIAYAMESGRMAAETVVTAAGRPAGLQRERVLRTYPDRVAAEYGGYFRLGHAFTKVIANPTVMQALAKYALPRRRLMEFSMRLLANLTDPVDSTGADGTDRVIHILTRLAPAA